MNLGNDLFIVETAKLCHEANRAYCKSIGDDSQLPWGEAPDWVKESAISGVKMHLDNPGATGEDSHINWWDEKIKEGWVYGEIKDPDASPPTHSCMVPYDELPIEQQIKDHIFRSVVHARKEF